jgi:hypothetical protein
MGTTTAEFGRLKVWKDAGIELVRMAKELEVYPLDVAYVALAPGSELLAKLKKAGDDFYFKDGKRGFTTTYIRARALEYVAAFAPKVVL